METKIPQKFVAVVLAAGHGTRMKSHRPKVLHEVLGLPMTAHVLKAAQDAGCSRAILILGADADDTFSTLSSAVESFPVEQATQNPPRGTGDAVRCALEKLGDEDVAVILNGDIPCIQSDDVKRVMDAWEANTLVVGTTRLSDPSGYGRIIRGIDGSPTDIREDRDCRPEEKSIVDVNLGIYAVDAALLARELPRLESNNSQGEYYLTDLVKLCRSSQANTRAVTYESCEDLMGVNDRIHLAHAEKRLRMRVLHKLMTEGVTLLDPERALVESSVQIGKDTVLEADVTIRGASTIGEGCRIGQSSVLMNATLGDGVQILPHCVLEQCTLESDVKAGPFARLRPGTILRKGSAVGNFVEMKKTDFGPGSKAGHLSYLGDATIGRGVNVGAGTITCNYDGTHKHPTVLEDGVFVGSDTQFVAPVHVGEKGYIGAGTTVTQDVPAGALAVSRVRQENKEGWVARRSAGSNASKPENKRDR